MLVLLVRWTALNSVLKELLVGLGVGVREVAKAGRRECLPFGINDLPPQRAVDHLSEVCGLFDVR